MSITGAVCCPGGSGNAYGMPKPSAPHTKGRNRTPVPNRPDKTGPWAAGITQEEMVAKRG